MGSGGESAVGQNRTKVGLKLASRRALRGPQVWQNRTKVGLKLVGKEHLDKCRTRQNRTKVGLKQQPLSQGTLWQFGQNRTKVGLKLGFSQTVAKFAIKDYDEVGKLIENLVLSI